MTKLKIAIQKKGRLSDKSLSLLKECGIKVSAISSKLKAEASNFPVEILFLRDDDIPQYVEQEVADIGILGENEVAEKQKDVKLIKKLGFSSCRLSLAIPKEETYTGISYFNGKKIATSYVNILSDYLNQRNITAEIEEITGSVEIAPSIGLAEAVCDIVSTGSTLFTNGLKEVESIFKSEAVLIASQELSKEKQDILDRLLFRIEAVKQASENKYILLNAPYDVVDKIADLLPSVKSPTVLPLKDKDWCSMHSVIKEDDFWDVIDQLKDLGAQGILIVPIEKMIL